MEIESGPTQLSILFLPLSIFSNPLITYRAAYVRITEPNLTQPLLLYHTIPYDPSLHPSSIGVPGVKSSRRGVLLLFLLFSLIPTYIYPFINLYLCLPFFFFFFALFSLDPLFVCLGLWV